MFKKIGNLICAIGLTTTIPIAMAEPHPQCEPPYADYANSYRKLRTSLDWHIRAALNELTPDTLKSDVDRPTERRDDFLVEKQIKPTNHQRLVARRMEREFCTIIYARQGPDDAKLEKYNTVRRHVWRPGSDYAHTFVRRGTSSTAAVHRDPSRQDAFMFTLVADPKGQIELYEQDSGADRDIQDDALDPRFVAHVPFFINDTNRHFVIIHSAQSVAEGKRVIEKFALRLPHMDFALYDRYRNSDYYGVMLATWVSKDVAMEALKIAREDLGVTDAYCWSYPDGANKCIGGTTGTEQHQPLSQQTLLTFTPQALP